MDSKSILLALQTGEINYSEAKILLLKIMGNTPQATPVSAPGGHRMDSTYAAAIAGPLTQQLALLEERPAGYFDRQEATYPELFHMNSVTTGTPVFWLHGGGGGIQPYIMIAQMSQRPFFGIQARGWMKENVKPIRGVKAMAAYYVEILKAVQPHGPYDLGGYSLAGCLAYEMTGLLQRAGEVVNSIVMIDSLSPAGLKLYQPDQKDYLLEIINILLLNTVMATPEKYYQVMIRREEVDVHVSDEAFLSQLILLAKLRGLKKDTARIEKEVWMTMEVQKAYEVSSYQLEDLPDPTGLTCYYFRNRNGLFYGDMEPYLCMAPPVVSLDHINYWEEWEQQLPDFHVIDVNAANHMIMLAEQEVHLSIIDFCAALYAKGGMTIDFLRSFKRITKNRHGSR
ncbi:thioesterase domain-containing protein [Chitinophaga nivalis]|uniref:Thioesterase domain-containing protein n=1 Tax=Chitinophaga nivalis TaxID=2991709 RepID=A0ABT3IMY6_9BACT|nr:thioesterase domain-containing protein [Chitinophaga nivalis]MCW3464996.1 thioesterase domain-containing protein [Chitinophaga nivalis]MCW3485312.1 thioesterase domain-containing protein [Chitinophaga nivalis]